MDFEKKKEVIGIRQSEEDISKLGMDKLSSISDEFRAEMKIIKADMKSIRKDMVSVKHFNKKQDSSETEDLDQKDCTDSEKPKTPRKRNNSYREPKIPSTIIEKLNSSEDEAEKEEISKKKVDKDKDVLRETKVEADTGETPSGAEFSRNYVSTFDDDHVRF